MTIHVERELRISSGGPRNCRSLGYARDDKGKGEASMESGCRTEVDGILSSKQNHLDRELPWACGPPRVMKNGLGPATTFYGTAALSFVIPSEAERSAVPQAFLEKRNLTPQQICHLDRSVAQWRDLRFFNTC
jgi:hypothetical protein